MMLAMLLVAGAAAMRSIALMGQSMCYVHGRTFQLSCFGQKKIFFFFFFFL